MVCVLISLCADPICRLRLNLQEHANWLCSIAIPAWEHVYRLMFCFKNRRIAIVIKQAAAL